VLSAGACFNRGTSGWGLSNWTWGNFASATSTNRIESECQQGDRGVSLANALFLFFFFLA